MKFMLIIAVLLALLFAALWLRSETQRKRALADLASAKKNLADLTQVTGTQGAQLADIQQSCDQQKSKQERCFTAACNIHLYAQLAAEEATSATQKQKYQVIAAESEKMLDLLKQ